MNKLVLGTAQFGLDYGINNSNGKVSNLEIQRILNFAYENNIRILDTAESYGNAHEIIGSYHKKNPKKKIIISEKTSLIICYGDAVYSNEKNSIKVFQSFFQKRLLRKKRVCIFMVVLV